MITKVDVLRIIKALGYPIVFLCDLFGVSRQSFYNYIDNYCQGAALPKKLLDFFDLITTADVSKKDVNRYLLSMCNRDIRFGNDVVPVPNELFKFLGLLDLKEDALVVNKTPVISDKCVFTDLDNTVRDAKVGVLKYSNQVAFSNFGFVGIPNPDEFRITLNNKKLAELYRTYFHLMFISTYIRSSGSLSSGLNDISTILDYVDYEMSCIEYVFKNMDEVDSEELPVLLGEVNRDTFDVTRKVYWFAVVIIIHDFEDDNSPVGLFSQCLRAVDSDDAEITILDRAEKLVENKDFDHVVFGPYKDEDVASSAMDHLFHCWKDESDNIGSSMDAAREWLNGMTRKKSMQGSEL